jgi:hypothetical protein
VRRPLSKAGNVWLDQYFGAIQRQFTSHGRDREAIRDAAQALSALLDREPDYAREVRQLALQCATGTYNMADAEDIAALARVAIDAELMSPDLVAEPTPTLLLLSYQADAERLAGQRLQGLATLDRLGTRRGKDQPGDPLHEFVRAREALVRAELNERDRELELAAQGFEACRAVMADLVGDGTLARSATEDFLDQVVGLAEDGSAEEHRSGFERTFDLMRAQTYVASLLGCMRTGAADTSPKRRSVAAQLEATLSRYGLVYAASPFLLIEALSALAPDEGESLIAAFEGAREAAPSRLLSQVDLTGLKPELADELRRRASAGGASTEYDDVSWSVALDVARGRLHESAGNPDAAEEAYVRAVELAVRTPYGLTKVCALGAYTSFRHRNGQLGETEVSLFLSAIGATTNVDPEAFDDLRFRALFDDAVAAATSWALADPAVLTTDESRLRLSVLLDLARRRRQPVSEVFLALGGLAQEESSAVEAHLALADTIERISAAVAERDDLVVLIPHNDELGGYFLVVDGDGAGIWPCGDLTAVLDSLDDAAERMVMLSPIGGDAAVADAALTAFRALPGDVQARVSRSGVLLVVPDYRHEEAVMPYELLHDGESYLMESKVVARFTSLEHLANTLDGGVGRHRTQRALVTAAPNGIPDRVLTTAIAERDAVRDSLNAGGFDTPTIDPIRLSADYYADRLPYVDVLHLAAHGESAAGTEYVLLEDARRLSVDDLAAAPAPWMPFVYLNTCQLARTRYLGGGQGRGLAYTCAELGAPAVVANTSDVLDQVSMVLATGFYEAGQGEPVGEALRQVRNQAIRAGFHPALVGRVVLFGDPFHWLVAPDEDAHHVDLAAALLDGFLGLVEPEDERDEIWGRVRVALGSGSADHRLVAAMGIVELLQDTGDEDRATTPVLTEAIALADALRHPPAQAILRLLRAEAALEGSLETGVEWTNDAIYHLRRLESEGEPWRSYLHRARASLRRRTYENQGITFTQSGPGSSDPTDLEAIADLLAGVQQAQEEKYGKVELRAREDSVEDMAWNAVVLGHPNRFEPSEVPSFARRLNGKLIASGNLPEASRAYAPEMLTGLLLYLWSTQKVGYLEPDLAEYQTAAVVALIEDIRDRWSPPPEGSAKEAFDRFGRSLDSTLAELDAMSWGEVVRAIPERVAARATEAISLLDDLAKVDPFAVSGAAAYLTGVFAARNTFSPLDGSVPEQIGEELDNALWSVGRGNDERFFPYLAAGRKALRRLADDELTRWRAAAT